MSNDRFRLELLSPARDADTGIAAIDHGADAVYIGGPSFGARQSAGNSLDDIARLAAYAHRYDAKVFMTLNTLFDDAELKAARRLAFDAADAGVDVLILQDMGLLMGELPNIELHASTQCDIRTPEKAKFLEDVGFSQMVLARELSLEEVRACYERLNHARIEYFIHGALCVSYSGQCYISHAMTGRSANRGECAQFCRLPYDVTTLGGQVLARNAHVLSLKDNNQTDNLEALIDAGVSSFKIEGRLKDIQYVKNITAHYRQALDKIIARRPELSRTSSGVSTFSFTPDPDKSFNRGSTDYFVHGKNYDEPYKLVDPNTPKNSGVPVGEVRGIRAGVVTLALNAGVTLNNGDGFTYLIDRGDKEVGKTLVGLNVNRIEPTQDAGIVDLVLRFREFPEGLRTGMTVLRNRDQAFTKLLANKTAERRIPVTLTFTETDTGFALTLSDGKNTVTHDEPFAREPASDPAKNQATLAKNLFKFGDTPFLLDPLALTIDPSVVSFVPASLANRMRREAVERLLAEREVNRVRTPRAPHNEAAVYPEKLLGFKANVANEAARRFYAMHGSQVLQPAFEIKAVEHADLMTCRHCIRPALNLCPKQLRYFPELLEERDRDAFRPESLILTDSAGDQFLAVFHCKRSPCEMTLEAYDPATREAPRRPEP